MEEIFKRAQKNSIYLFLGSILLVGFFILAVQFNKYSTSLMVGEPLPEIAKSDWIARPDDRVDAKNITLLFFWRPGVKVSDEMLAWSVTLDWKYRKSGLQVVGVINTAMEKELSTEMLQNRLRQKSVRFNFAVDETGELRKKFRHYSFATYFLADRDGVIMVVGDASDGMDPAEKEILRLLQ